VCLGMIWDSDQPKVEDIMSVVYSIGLKLQLSDVSDHGAPRSEVRFIDC